MDVTETVILSRVSAHVTHVLTLNVDTLKLTCNGCLKIVDVLDGPLDIIETSFGRPCPGYIPVDPPGTVVVLTLSGEYVSETGGDPDDPPEAELWPPDLGFQRRLLIE